MRYEDLAEKIKTDIEVIHGIKSKELIRLGVNRTWKAIADTEP